MSNVVQDDDDTLNLAEAVLEKLQQDIHETSEKKGWWTEYTNLKELLDEHGETFSLNSAIADDLYKFARTMLIVSELSEGIEALRCGNAPDDKLPEFEGLSVELADAIIRILDLAAQFDIPVIPAVIKKMQYNKTRRYKHGGKSI